MLAFRSRKRCGQLREAFKLASEKSRFAKSFLEYFDAARDESVLRQTVGVHERLFPTFNTIGTVSGRILVSDPYLQQLWRPFRRLLSADAGKRLAYLDYSQFEPGILASLSNDAQLIDACNRGDFYTALSEKVFHTEGKSSISKRMFLAFCYGMSANNIS